MACVLDFRAMIFVIYRVVYINRPKIIYLVMCLWITKMVTMNQ